MGDRVHPRSRSAGPRPADPVSAPRSGRPLDTVVRAAMEPRFGRDFSQVRVHTDAAAAESARALGVVAYTVGHDVVFGSGRWAPGTASGDRVLAHELAHVVQQERPSGTGPADASAEGRARAAAEAVAGGASAPPERVGRAPHGLAADDGRGLAPGSSGGRLKISAQLVDDLRKKGLLNPELAAMIARGEILLDPEPSGAGSLAAPFTTTPPRASLGFGPLPPSRLGGSRDPVGRSVPPLGLTFPPTVLGPQNWLTRLTPSLKASFSLFEGLTIENVARPGTGTTIFVSGVTTKLGKTKGGIAGQVELGWDKTLGFQISGGGWYLHGEANPDGAWGFTLSFPSESPMPVLPWVSSIFNEGALALRELAGIAGEGPPTGDLDALMKRVKPNITRMKNAVDAAKGVLTLDPRVSGSLMIGSGPAPGTTPADKPSGFYVGGSLIVSF